MNILVIEDDNTLCEFLGLLFRELHPDSKVTFFKTCKSVFDNIRKDKPDVVILDYLLDECTAEPIVELIRQEWKKEVKIVICSASSNINEIAKLMDIDVVVKKPFTIEDLMNVIFVK